MDKITYARVRDIIVRNAFFVDQSGTFPKKFSDYSDSDTHDISERAADLARQSLAQEIGVPVTKESTAMWSLLGGLGSHDLSLMREALGSPLAVLGCSLNPSSFWKSVFFLLMAVQPR